MEEKEQNKKFSLFRKKEPKGVTKEEVEIEENSPRNVKLFFKLLKRNFSKLLTLNLFMLFMVIPIVIGFYVYLQGPMTESKTSVLSPTLFGVSLISDSPAVALMKTTFGFGTSIPAANSPVFIIIGVLALILAITWGWQNIGATYILRSMVRGEPVFMWSDYFYAIKKNMKQGFFVGLLDFVFMCVLGFDIFFFSGISGSFWQDVMYFCTIGLAVIYCIMRYYLYLMLITFDLSTFKLLKNSLIFTALGVKRNLAASLGVILMALLNFVLAVLLMQINVIVFVILPFVYFLPVSAFMTAYAAYPNIKKYMVDPYVKTAEAA